MEKNEIPSCGPLAISIITGEPFEEVETAVRALFHSDYSATRSLSLDEIWEVLLLLGWSNEEVVVLPDSTVSSFLKTAPEGRHLVLVHRHIFPVHLRSIQVDDHRYLNHKIESVWEISRLTGKRLQKSISVRALALKTEALKSMIMKSCGVFARNSSL